ncbi:MAG: type III-A CRISPR-associated protein Cas10/Csm1 [Nitrososphaerales archaeon]
MENDTSEKELMIRYSSLLHDIGKFHQRCAGITRRLEQQEAAVLFLEKADFPPFLKELKDKIINLVGSHHPQRHYKEPYDELKDLLDILTKADGISAKEREQVEEEVLMDDIFRKPLLSIFSEVHLEKRPEPKEKFYHEIAKLDYGERILPKQRHNLPESLSGHYASLWSNFKDEFNLLSRINDRGAHFITLYNLLLKYTFLMPSATIKCEPDISLFEHLSTTCAIAESLYKGDGKNLVLIGGDVCGIQDFIYTITSEQAAKMLRGRSFYVRLINQTIGLYILKELGLSLANMIFCGGGNFTILAPYTSDYEKKLKEVIKKVNQCLLEKFEGELYVAISYLKIEHNELEDYGKLSKELGRKIENAKLKQFADIMPDKYDKVLGPIGGNGDVKICNVCKREVPEQELEHTDEIEICKQCKSIENIGVNLVKSNYLIMVSYNPQKPPKFEFDVDFEELGFGYIFASEKGIKETLEVFSKLPLSLIKIIRLNSTEFLSEELLQYAEKINIPIAFSFDFVGKQVPIDSNGKVISFDSMVKNSEGADYLGALRMDVDNLGRLFSEGLKNRTVSRISTMSRLLSIFFEGYLNWLVEEKYKDKVYMVYSGGDDLFLMGCWDAVCDLSVEIQEKFSEMTSKNPSVTISAGLVLAEPKWPVYREAQVAKDYLDYSKEVREEKNSITIFSDKKIEEKNNSITDYTVSWEDLRKLMGLKEELYNLIKDRILSRGFLFTLRRLYQIHKRGEEARAEWLLRYVIARLIREHQSSTNQILNLEGLIRSNIKYLDIPIIWTELQTRRR